MRRETRWTRPQRGNAGSRPEQPPQADDVARRLQLYEERRQREYAERFRRKDTETQTVDIEALHQLEKTCGLLNEALEMLETLSLAEEDTIMIPLGTGLSQNELIVLQQRQDEQVRAKSYVRGLRGSRQEHS